MNIDELHRLWTIEGRSLRECARELDSTVNVVKNKIVRLRLVDGEEMWPRRGDPIRRPRQVPKPIRARPGVSTLPPLASELSCAKDSR